MVFELPDMKPSLAFFMLSSWLLLTRPKLLPKDFHQLTKHELIKGRISISDGTNEIHSYNLNIE
jgi:hypothetical protein